MKKVLNSIFLVLMAILLPTMAHAHAFVVNGIYYNITGSNEVAVTYKGNNPYEGSYSGNIVIPQTVSYTGKSYNVTSIGENAFMFCDNLTKVTIGSLVTSIGENSFFDCTNLSSVTFPSSLVSIGDGAFFYCSKLSGLTLPNSLTTIGSTAFYACSSLSNLTIPRSVTTIGFFAFANCSGLSSITIPSSVTTIEDNPFVGCSGLRSITVESGNPNYDSREGCNAIIETATNKLISGCQRTTILGSVTTIGEHSFTGCTGLTSLTIPSSVTTIGGYAFEDCTGLTSITIPSTVLDIEENPFFSCSGLESITVESGNPNYDSRENCNAIIWTKGNELISGCMNTTIPHTVTALGDESFGGCTELTSINIPNSITEMGGYTFWGCTGLQSVVIPNSVNTLYDYVFFDCSQLTSVTIPNSVIYIGESAFAECSKLPSITIPASVTFIGESAFEECRSLRDVYSYIQSPADVSMADNVFYIFYDSYWGRTLHVPAGSLAAYQADNKWSDFFRQIVEMPIVIPGDVNGDEEVNIIDVNVLIDAIIRGSYDSAIDVNGDGEVNISDINAIIDIILK